MINSTNRYDLEVSFLENEFWYGGIVDKGICMPLEANSDVVLDMQDNYMSLDQSAPFMLSSAGRYIWSEKPFIAEVKDAQITCRGSSEMILSEGHKNLKGAYVDACGKYFSFSKEFPDELFFEKPQYNTWIELQYNQTQEGILNYAKGILDNGFPAGILMIDDGWAEDYGVWKFHKGKFSNPKEMVEKLHEMGFKVMLWVIPVVSPDSMMFRELKSKGCLLQDKNGDIVISKWWNGYSAVLDISKQEACDIFKSQLDWLQEEYGVDGFKFDGGDAYFYGGQLEDEKLFPQMFTEMYNKFALQYRFNELRSAWKFAGKAIVTRLQDKHHSWSESGLNCLIPNSLIQSLLGYVYHCPDMIGGGDVGCDYSRIDEELIVRYAQVSAFMPMMQFSLAPWRVLSEEKMNIVRNAALLHVRHSDYILKYAKEASQTGYPIIRHMAFAFPDEGFETVMDQFMLGDDLLIAPIVTQNTYKRMVKLPKGMWEDECGKTYQGDSTIEVEVPLDRIPYYKWIG